MMQVRWFCVALLACLVGCLNAQPTADGEPLPPPPPPMLQGYVVDESLAPIAGAKVSHGGATNTTASTGYFRIARATGPLVVESTGFEPVIVHVGTNAWVNATLIRLPDETPYTATSTWTGLIHCQVVVVAGHDHGDDHDDGATDCDPSTEDERYLLAVPVTADGVILEVFWDASTPAGEYLSATLFAVDGEGQRRSIGFTEGTSPLRLHLGEGLTNEMSGGVIEMKVAAGAPDEDAAAGTVWQQEYQVVASVFHYAPAPVDYSVAAS